MPNKARQRIHLFDASRAPFIPRPAYPDFMSDPSKGSDQIFDASLFLARGSIDLDFVLNVELPLPLVSPA